MPLRPLSEKERQAFEGYVLFFWKGWLHRRFFDQAMKGLGFTQDECARIRFWVHHYKYRRDLRCPK